MRQRIRSVRLPVIVTFAVLLLGFAYLISPKMQKVHAQAAGLSNASLNGNYAFLLNKPTSDVASSVISSLGVASFDGNGNVSGSFTTYVTGADQAIQTGTFNGNYTVNGDGTGSMNVTTSTGDNPTSFLVITDGGSKVNLMQTGGGTVLTGVAQQQ